MFSLTYVNCKQLSSWLELIPQIREYFSAYPFLSISGNVVTEIVYSFLHGSSVLNGTGAENTLWSRIECNIRKYYCSEPSEAQGLCASSLKHDWAFPSLLPFLIFSSTWWSNSWWSGSGRCFPAHADPWLRSQHKAHSGNSFLLVLLSPPIAGSGGQATQLSSCLLGSNSDGGQVRPWHRTPFTVAQPLPVENPYGESAVATSRAARSVKWLYW